MERNQPLAVKEPKIQPLTVKATTPLRPSCNNSAEATQRFSANRKTSSELKNRSSLFLEQSQRG